MPLCPHVFIKKATRGGDPERVQVSISRETPSQTQARHKAYSDPQFASVKASPPQFFSYVTSGGLSTTKQYGKDKK